MAEEEKKVTSTRTRKKTVKPQEKNVENKKQTTKKSTTKKATTTKKEGETTKKTAGKTATDTKTTSRTRKTTTRTKKTTTTKAPSSAKKATKQAKKEDKRIDKILAEQLAKVELVEEKQKEISKKESEDKKEEVVKNKKKKTYNPEEIAKKIEAKKKMPKEQKRKLYSKIGLNILVACAITLYFIFVNLGFLHIEGEVLITDLKVFSLTLIAVSIIMFENAYSKDSGTLTLYGIEILITAIISLISIYVYIINKDIFMSYIIIASAVIIAYYIIKAIFMTIYAKKEYKKTISDVKEIIDED